MSTAKTAKPDHDFDPHWSLTQQHATDISELKSGQARLEVGLSHVSHTLNSEFASLRTTLAERTQPSPPTPWIQICGLVATLMIMLGGTLTFGFSLVTSSMQREMDMRFAYYSEDISTIETTLREQHADRDAQHMSDVQRITNVETGMRAIGDYIKEHTAKPSH